MIYHDLSHFPGGGGRGWGAGSGAPILQSSRANITFCQIFPKSAWNLNNLGPPKSTTRPLFAHKNATKK